MVCFRCLKTVISFYLICCGICKFLCETERECSVQRFSISSSRVCIRVTGLIKMRARAKSVVTECQYSC